MELRGLEPLTFWLPARRSSQLSYSPVECEVVCKGNARTLSIARRSEAKVNDRLVGQWLSGQQETTVKLSAVDGEEVHLTCAVPPLHVAVGRAPRCEQRNDHDISLRSHPSPLDLDAEQVAADLQREVSPPVFCNRPQDRDAEPGRRQHDRLLGYGPFDVRVHDERMFA